MALPGGRGPLWALLGVALQVVEVVGHSQALLFNVTPVVDGCYYVNRRYEVLSKSDWRQGSTAVDYKDCQRQCQSVTACAFFGFWKETQTCWLASANAVFTSSNAVGAVTGPKHCPDVPAACTDKPGAGFPGATETASKLAWPSHRVPDKLECWPTNSTGGFYDSCPVSRILEDTATGWRGLCTGLLKVPAVPPGETCESYCRKKVLCVVYQVANDTERSCYHSSISGSDCYSGSADPSASASPLEAKRIMHGEVRVLASIVGVQIMGLMQVFDENEYSDVLGQAVPACRNNCYSNIGCSWWQYSESTGCWVEDPRKPVDLPMTTAGWQTGTDFASTVVGGEYIQHVCPGGAGLPAATTTPGPGSAADPFAPPVAAGEAPAPAPDSRSALPVLPVGTLPPTSAPSPSPTPSGAAVPGTPDPEGWREAQKQDKLPPAPQSRFHGAMAVQGLSYTNVTEPQRVALANGYVKAIASAAGVSPDSVQDEEGTLGQVTLGADPVEPAKGTRAGFFVNVPAGIDVNDVNEALQTPAFLANVKDASQRAVGLDEAALAALEINAHVERTTPRPTSIPTTSAAPPATPSFSAFGFPHWSITASLLAIMGLALGACAFACSQRKEDQQQQCLDVTSPKQRKSSRRFSSPKATKRKVEDGYDSDSALFNELPPPEPDRQYEVGKFLVGEGVEDGFVAPQDVHSRDNSRVPLLAQMPQPKSAGALQQQPAAGGAAGQASRVRPPTGPAPPAGQELPAGQFPPRQLSVAPAPSAQQPGPPPVPVRYVTGPMPSSSPLAATGAQTPAFPSSISVTSGSVVPDPVRQQAFPSSVSVASGSVVPDPVRPQAQFSYVPQPTSVSVASVPQPTSVSVAVPQPTSVSVAAAVRSRSPGRQMTGPPPVAASTRSPQAPPPPLMFSSQGVQLQGVQPQGVQPQGVQPQDVQPQGVQPQGVQLQGVQPQGVQPQGVQPRGMDPRRSLSTRSPSQRSLSLARILSVSYRGGSPPSPLRERTASPLRGGAALPLQARPT